MKALLPVYCRPLGYLVIALGVFMPILMALMGRVTDANLVFYKECAKLLMLWLFLHKNPYHGLLDDHLCLQQGGES